MPGRGVRGKRSRLARRKKSIVSCRSIPRQRSVRCLTSCSVPMSSSKLGEKELLRYKNTLSIFKFFLRNSDMNTKLSLLRTLNLDCFKIGASPVALSKTTTFSGGAGLSMPGFYSPRPCTGTHINNIIIIILASTKQKNNFSLHPWTKSFKRGVERKITGRPRFLHPFPSSPTSPTSPTSSPTHLVPGS